MASRLVKKCMFRIFDLFLSVCRFHADLCARCNNLCTFCELLRVTASAVCNFTLQKQGDLQPLLQGWHSRHRMVTQELSSSRSIWSVSQASVWMTWTAASELWPQQALIRASSSTGTAGAQPRKRHQRTAGSKQPEVVRAPAKRARARLRCL